MYSVSFMYQVVLVFCFVAVISHNAKGQIPNHHAAIYQVFPTRRAPYIMQLRDMSGEFFCAGSLVAPQFVITAAECFDDRDHTKAVVVGAANTLTEEGVQRKISKITKHPEYTTDTKHSNAAVLKLDEPFDADKFVPIPLVEEAVKEGDFLTTFGWRHLLKDEDDYDTLFAIMLGITSQAKCDQDFNATDGKHHFCVIGKRFKEYYPVGDLGGPARKNGKLAGVALACHNCKDIDHTVSYTDLFQIKSFIEAAMK